MKITSFYFLDMEDAERQAFEIEALESIYDGLKVVDNKGTILLDIELEDEVKIGSKSVNYLPSIQFKFKLLPTYPSSSPPLLHLSSSWLSLAQLTVQGSKLVRIKLLFSSFIPDQIWHSAWNT